MKEHMIDTFCNSLDTTIRDCLGCRALIGGGASRCVRCEEAGIESTPNHYRLRPFTVVKDLVKQRLGVEIVTESLYKQCPAFVYDTRESPIHVKDVFNCYYAPVSEDGITLSHPHPECVIEECDSPAPYASGLCLAHRGIASVEIHGENSEAEIPSDDELNLREELETWKAEALYWREVVKQITSQTKWEEEE